MNFDDYLRTVTKLYSDLDQSMELRKPATATKLGQLEKKWGHRLPQGLRAAWRTTDGTDQNLFARPKYLTGYAFLSVADALKERASFEKRAPRYAGWIEPKPRDRRIQPGWFHEGWLPFASFFGSLVLLVDASPAKPGKVGQIIAFTHDPDQMTYVAASFEELLKKSLPWIRKHAYDLLAE